MPHLLPAAASAIAAAAPAAASTAAATAAKVSVMTTLKSVAFNALTNLAISAALSVFTPTVGAAARTVEFVIDPDGPIPFAAGHIGVPGAMAHKDTFGPDLMYYGIPVILSGAGPITAIQSVKADDYPMAFDANGGATTEPYRQEFFFRSVLGHQPAPAALSLPNGLKGGGRQFSWSAAHKLSGKAAFLMVMAENSKGSAFPNGEVKPLVELLGLKGWDPTQDSTYPGGNGPCRLHDASTWVTLTCPILWGLKWALGLWEGPTLKGAPAHDSTTDHQVGGIGARLSGVDVPAFVAASNIAKANAWTVSAYPNTDDDKHQVLETFLQAGGAIYSQRAGKISCISRAAPRASLVTISAADTAGPLEIDTAASRIDRINTLRPRFWSPAHRWQMTAMDGEVTAQSYRDEDGGRTRSRGVDFPFVSNAKQTGQLAALQIANTREGIAGVIPLKPHLQRIRPGDAFTITEAGFVLNGLKCLCLNTDYDPATGVVRVSFVSETDAKYPFALGQNPTPPTPQVLTPVDPRFVSPPEAGDWTVTPRPPAPGGGQLPGFDLAGIVSNATATAIIVEYGLSAAGPWKQAYQGPPTVTNIPLDGLQPGVQYWIAIQYQRNQNYSEREVFGPFTAPDLVAGDLSPESPVWTEIELQGVAITEVTDRLVGVEAITQTVQQGIDDLEEVFGDTVSAAASAASAIQQAAIATQAKADALIAAGDAADRASEANEERIKAETARGQAEGFRSQSAASATTATGAASTATEQAGLAATARGEAQGFAGAALESRNQASGFVTAAEAAAAVSTTQKLEAVAALNAMGRQNIVARENATTPADVFTVTTGGLSGWGFQMVGNGGGVVVTREIKVGPLKKNTAYSVSFLARRGGVDPVPLKVDLFPDSLPETTFNITSENWTRYTWEGITSASDDMALATILLRFFELIPAGNAFEITDIKLEEGATATAWTPSPKDAATSARASAQSASQASASETAAGQQAATATQERIDAQTARGQAEAFKNETASSRDTATAQAALATAQAGLSAGSATLAGQKAGASSDSASLASTKADEAGASAAASRADQISAGAARDQALAALMAQGRQNLVARENVASGQLVAVSSGGASGWGFSMVGSGGNVTRTIKVGPLKANTAYSISFKARRTSGSGSLPINVDLNPDTLPERTFDIQSNALTEFKWENITSPSTDMALATVQLRFFRAPLPTGYTYEITDIKLEEGATATAWTPSPKDAAYSASASATSAASAAASDTSAGQSATAASGSATAASTKAGEASTFASQASTSAGNAAGSAVTASNASGVAVTARDQANDARDAAQGSAATALVQAANASASAASASISANLAASTSAVRGNLLPNGGMERGLEGITSSASLYIDNNSWGHTLRLVPSGNGTYTVTWAPVNIFGGATYTVSGDALLFADSGTRYFDMIFLDAGGNVVRDGGEKPMGPGGYSNDRARINDMAWTEQAPSNATRVIVRAIFEGLVNPTAIGARRVKLELGASPATAYTADAAVGALSSQLQITAAVAASVEGRMASTAFEVIGSSGGDPAQLLVKTTGTNSLVQLVASALRFGNVIGGQIVDVMKLVGGSVFITGKLLLGAAGQIELDPAYPLILWKFGSARLAIGQIPNDQLFFWFGPSVEVGQMRRNNATVYMDRNGRGHWMGAITAGTISNSIQGSNVNVPVSATLGPFSTNGGPIVVNWSYSFDRSGRRWGNQTGGVSGTTSALVRLYQKIGNSAETLVDTMTVNGDLSASYDAEPVPGQPSGTVGRTFISEYMGASKTYTDNVGGTAARTYRVEVASRSNKSVSGQSAAADSMDQRYGATSSE